ncbi:MAG TPA: carboxymuconolactone decarboxylase family protein [Acidimicrobiales bacterium]|nr:carboxymuconolactone decarboxylase family protein [Acidimicrobiales bacterium]
MARVPYLEPEQVPQQYRSLLARPATLFKALGNSPEGLRAFGRLGSFIRNDSTLNPRLREMAILQVGYLTGTAYEWTHHIDLAMEHFGVSADDIRAIGVETAGHASAVPTLDRAVLRAAREMTSDLNVSDETWAELARDLSAEHLVDLVLAIGFYNLVVRVLQTLEVDLEPEYQHYLTEFPLPR